MKKLLQYFSKPKKEPTKWFIARPESISARGVFIGEYVLLEKHDPNYFSVRLVQYTDGSAQRNERADVQWSTREACKISVGWHWSAGWSLKEIPYEEAFAMLL